MTLTVEEARSRVDAYVDRLRQLVSLDTPTTEPQLVNTALQLVAGWCRDLGASIAWEDGTPYKEPRGRVLLARFGQDRPRRALLLGHVDTVWPAGEAARRPFRVHGGRIVGPGVYDMKGGLVLAVEALRWLRQRHVEPAVTCLFTPDEEIGSWVSRAIIEREASAHPVALCFEPPAGEALVVQRKGIMQFTVRAIGRSSHAGIAPEKGVNAVEEMAHQILAIQGMAGLEPGTTVSCDVVRGGERVNVVPAEATLDVDVRIPSLAARDAVTQAFRGLAPVLPGARLEVTPLFKRPPMVCTGRTRALADTARETGRELGLRIEFAASGGISDGNFAAAVGCPTLDGLGPVGDDAHALQEHLDLDALPSRLALVTALIQRLAQDP